MASFDEVSPLGRVALRHARDAFRSQAQIERSWRALGYGAPPDYGRALAEYEAFAAQLTAGGTEVEWLPGGDGLGLDAIYVRDATLVTPGGLVVCRMGKAARSAEPAAARVALHKTGLPVLGEITGAGALEGGDVVWLDARSCIVGRGYRTNDEGIRQLRGLLGPEVELCIVPLPHHRGPDDVFHLMSILSPLDRDLALVYSPLMPVPFREWLLDRGLSLVEVPDQEFESMACNVLALAPRRCLMLAGNPVTRSRLEAAGCQVAVYDGSEISAKGAGGPTCLTRPLTRL